MAKWPKLTLREAGVALIDCDHRTPPACDAGFPYVAIPQLRNGWIDFSDVRKISAEDFIDWTRKAKPKAHDVVLSRRCNPGETAYVPPGIEFALGQNLVLLRASGEKVYPPFLRWLVRGPEWWEQIAKFLNVGALFDSLKCADVPDFELHIPPMEEQRAIARILGTLDGKIELNRRMNETLEAMARALFKSWFVDFDPVRAKAEGRDPGLPKHLADLLPDSFEESELGEIPKGWEVVSLRQLASIQGGKQLPTEQCQPDGNYPVYGANGVMGYSDRPTHQGFVIVFGRVGAYCGSIHWSYGGAWVNNNASAIVPTSWPEYVLQATLDIDFQAMRTGSAQPFIPNTALAEARVLRPGDGSLQAYCATARHLRLQQSSQDNQSRTLAALRDALLPKLISGEIRVPKLGEHVKERLT